MSHPDPLRLQAYFDGEVDPASATGIELHIEQCADCSASLQHFEHTRAALREELTSFRASSALRARLAQALDEEPMQSVPHSRRKNRWLPHIRPFWAGALGGSAATLMAAFLAFMIFTPLATNALRDDLVSAHLRSLVSTHPIDVESSDRHTVKPWFAGHADVSPDVADFKEQGYTLVGGRTDYLDQQRAAVLVYRHGPHLINVFSWASSPHFRPSDATVRGYHLVFWKVGDLAYCAISDTAPAELMQLVQLLRQAGDQRTRG